MHLSCCGLLDLALCESQERQFFWVVGKEGESASTRLAQASAVLLSVGKPSPSRASSTWHPLLPRLGLRAVNLSGRSRALWTGV